jgi:WD40-like Beta Propeller Repeat
MPTLSPDRWEQIRTEFEQIVDRDTGRRNRRLKTIAAKDPALGLTLAALLQADAQANDWLAPVESPLGFAPPAAEELSGPPNDENVLGAPWSRTSSRWLLLAVSVVALGVGGMAVVRQFDQPAAITEADWQAQEADWRAPAPRPVIAAPRSEIGANSYSLVGVNLRGEERPLVDLPKNARLRGPNVLDTGYFAWPKISPDGRRIALEVRTGDGRWDLWVYDMPSRRLTRLTHDFTGVKPFGWSADSRNLIYLAVENGWMNRVVSQPWDGSAPPRQLLRRDAPILNVALGPWGGDAVIRGLGGNDDVWIGPLREPAALRPLVVTKELEVDLRISRDGQLLAYASGWGSPSEIYVQPLNDPSKRVQVSRGGGTQPVWSPDGRQLFYRTADRMMRATVRRRERLTIDRVDTLFADIYERHDVTNYDVFPSADELVMVRARPR